MTNIVAAILRFVNPRHSDAKPPLIEQAPVAQLPGDDKWSRDDWSRAALQILPGLPSAKDSFWGGTVEECDRAHAQVERMREEYAAYEPPKMRRAIMHWLDYADDRIADNREDVLTGKRRRDVDAYQARADEERRRAHDLARQAKTMNNKAGK